MPNDFVVMIPALNEEDSIALVLADLPRATQQSRCQAVIVVDNGSEDATAELAKASGAYVVRESRRGYGQACLSGMAYLQKQVQSRVWAKPDFVVFIDADFSDDPRELTDLLVPLENHQADFVLGSRMLGKREPGSMYPQAIWGNRLATWLMQRLLGFRYTDLGPFRAIRYDHLMQLGMCDRKLWLDG